LGRDKELQQLHNILLSQPDRVMVVAITGMGGIGKTELAKQYVHRHHEDYTGGIWWLRSQGRVEQGLNYGQRMQLPGVPDTFQVNEDSVHWYYDRWLDEIPEGKRLLIFDNVVDYEEIESLLPQDSRFSVLLTTRVKLNQPVQRLELETLKRASAFSLLRKIVNDDARISKEVESAKALCDWVGLLPLGVELIGRHLASRPFLELNKLLKRLDTQKLQTQALNQVPPSEMPYKCNLESAFELSWQLLDDAAKQMGGLLSLFAPTVIAPEWVETSLSNWHEEEQESAISDLMQCSLMTLEGGQYLLHNLIREFFLAKLESELSQFKKSFITRVVHALNIFFSESRNYKNWILCNHLYPHVRASCVLIREQRLVSLEVMSLLSKLAHYSFELAQYEESRLIYWHLYFLYKTDSKNEEKRIIECLNSLVEIFEAQGRYYKAERFANIVIQRIQKSSNQHPLGLARSLYNLGMIYEGQGCYHQSEKCLSQAQAIQAQELGLEGLDVARTTHYIGKLKYLRNQYDKAEIDLVEALNIRRKLLGINDPDVAVTMDVLASVYIEQGRYDEAEEQLQKVLEIRKSTNGIEHPYAARSWNSLGVLYYRQNEYSRAEKAYKKSIEIWKKYFNEKHPEEGVTLSNFAALLCCLARFEEAEYWYQESLKIIERKLGREHPVTALILFNFGFNCFFGQQRFSEAESKCVEAVHTLRRKTPFYPSLAKSLCCLADVYLAQDNLLKIQPLYWEAIEIYERTLGKDAPETIETRELYIWFVSQFE
jgi:tetratricopeptide (TPR) repeat protein